MQHSRWSFSDMTLVSDSRRDWYCGNESTSISGDRAGDSQSGEAKSDEHEPEWPVLFTSN